MTDALVQDITPVEFLLYHQDHDPSARRSAAWAPQIDPETAALIAQLKRHWAGFPRILPAVPTHPAHMALILTQARSVAHAIDSLMREGWLDDYNARDTAGHLLDRSARNHLWHSRLQGLWASGESDQRALLATRHLIDLIRLLNDLPWPMAWSRDDSPLDPERRVYWRERLVLTSEGLDFFLRQAVVKHAVLTRAYQLETVEERWCHAQTALQNFDRWADRWEETWARLGRELTLRISPGLRRWVGLD